jgi:hypothetical protein
VGYNFGRMVIGPEGRSTAIRIFIVNALVPSYKFHLLKRLDVEAAGGFNFGSIINLLTRIGSGAFGGLGGIIDECVFVSGLWPVGQWVSVNRYGHEATSARLCACA